MASNLCSKSKSNMTEDVHVVIVGGGYGGMCAAAELQKGGIPFTLIDPKEYFHHNVAALRSAVDLSYGSKSAIEFEPTFGGSFIRGTVDKILFEEKKVLLVNGDKEISFTHLILATGSRGPFPCRPHHGQQGRKEELLEEYRKMSVEISKAEHVVIIGGGAVGIEFAGEIMDVYKGDKKKKVTIVSSGQLLSNSDFPESFKKKMKAALQDWIGVNLILEEKVTNLDELTFERAVKGQVIKTDKDNSIEADLVLKCTGLQTEDSLAQTSYQSYIDANMRVKVDSALQVEGLKNVFAIGDCCNTPEEKMAAYAQRHGEHVAKNIVDQVKKGKTEMKPYSKPFTGMIITVGKDAGVGVMQGWNLPSFACAYLKSKDLFSSRYWGIMNQKMPQ